MGQQQLLYIVLGVILVGGAAIVGMNLFQANAIEGNRNGVSSDLLHLANMAQAYHKKSAVQGGGNKSFIGFTLPSNMQSNLNGTYTIESSQKNRLLMQGVGKEEVDAGFGCGGGGNYVTHRILVFPDSLRIEQVY